MNSKTGLLLLFLSIIVPVNAQTGYVNTTTFGFLRGTKSDHRRAPLSFISEHHYMIRPNLSAGIMTGIEQLNENTLPLAGCVRLQSRGTVHFFCDGYAGYAISLEKPDDPYFEYKKAKGGFMAGTGVGFYVPVNDCAAVFFGIGYRYNILHYELNDWSGDFKRNFRFNRLNLRLGIVLL
jgi:hypothetical protein